MAVTMAEIAERAGVAKVTVSLALRNSRKVATDTRKRIRALAKEMGYRKVSTVFHHLP